MAYHLFSRRLVVARKDHRCVWCFNPILSGSRYLREASIFDGRHQDFAWHEACNKAAQDYFADTGDETFISGEEMPSRALYDLEIAICDAGEDRDISLRPHEGHAP